MSNKIPKPTKTKQKRRGVQLRLPAWLDPEIRRVRADWKDYQAGKVHKVAGEKKMANSKFLGRVVIHIVSEIKLENPINIVSILPILTRLTYTRT